MFEWCFRNRYRTAAFGIVVAVGAALLAGRLGVGSLAVVLGVVAGMPVFVAGSPSLEGERYLEATTPTDRALDSVATAVGALLVALVVAIPAARFLGPPVPALLGGGAAVLAGQIVFFLRNIDYLDSD